MNELQQQQLLKELISVISQRAGGKVDYHLCSKANPRGFHLRVVNPPSNRIHRKNVFVYGTTTARLGRLSVGTWEKCIGTTNLSTMSNWKRDTLFGEPGVRWDIYQPHDQVYNEVISALSIACKYCLT